MERSLSSEQAGVVANPPNALHQLESSQKAPFEYLGTQSSLELSKRQWTSLCNIATEPKCKKGIVFQPFPNLRERKLFCNMVTEPKCSRANSRVFSECTSEP